MVLGWGASPRWGLQNPQNRRETATHRRLLDHCFGLLTKQDYYSEETELNKEDSVVKKGATIWEKRVFDVGSIMELQQQRLAQGDHRLGLWIRNLETWDGKRWRSRGEKKGEKDERMSINNVNRRSKALFCILLLSLFRQLVWLTWWLKYMLFKTRSA